MNSEPTEQEETWIEQWLSLIDKLPVSLMLMIDSDASDAPVVVLLPEEDRKTASHTRWINRMTRHLDSLPEGDGWLLANTEGWHFGKGDPTVTSSSSYGVYGACSRSSDDYASHYVESVDVDYGSIPDDYQRLAELHSDAGSRNARLISK